MSIGCTGGQAWLLKFVHMSRVVKACQGDKSLHKHPSGKLVSIPIPHPGLDGLWRQSQPHKASFSGQSVVAPQHSRQQNNWPTLANGHIH